MLTYKSTLRFSPPSRCLESTRSKRFLLRCYCIYFVASLVQVGHVQKYAPSLPGGSTPRICLPETLFTVMEWILLFSPSRCLESTRSKRFLLRCYCIYFVASLVQVGHVQKYAPSLPGGSTPRICLPETLFAGMKWILLFSPSRCLESTRSKRFLVERLRRLSARCLV